MINQEDIIEIDREYFEIIGKKDFVLVLRSRNTGHYWSLLEQVYNGHRTFQICHKHKEAEPYHPQKNRPSIVSCCEYIRSHDAFYQEKEKRKKERRLRRLGLITGEDPQDRTQKRKKKKRRENSGDKQRFYGGRL